MDSIDCVIVGAGVIGLAIARKFAAGQIETLVLERESAIGTGISARNSEVIHAGIYYPPGSMKAELCVQGKRMLYDYCQTRGVPHRRYGKLIVANGPDQEESLEKLCQNALANGVESLTRLTADKSRELEPALRCSAALLSPSTGVIDSHGLMMALLGEAQDHGALLALNCELRRAEVHEGRIRLWVDDAPEPALECRLLINCAGLAAVALANRIDGLDLTCPQTAYLAKGHYFSLLGRCPFQRLIYPMPEPGGLGVHLTLDLNRRPRFGPDVLWVDDENYDVDPARADNFYPAIRAYWPSLPDGALTPAYAGIRPKISGPGEAAADFSIDTSGLGDGRGVINLLGIESPGLTSSLAIADRVKQLVDAIR